MRHTPHPSLIIYAASPPLSPRIVKRGERDYVVTYKSGSGAEETLEVGLVMMATGRKPKTQGIGLEVSTCSL